MSAAIARTVDWRISGESVVVMGLHLGRLRRVRREQIALVDVPVETARLKRRAQRFPDAIRTRFRDALYRDAGSKRDGDQRATQEAAGSGLKTGRESCTNGLMHLVGLLCARMSSP